MKKFVLPFFSCLLVLTLLLGSFSSVNAAVGDDPLVTPISGDMEFTVVVVPIASLPGLAEYDQMLVPVGFPEGEAQFEGAGVLVTKFDAGKATACFTISGTQWGWGGKVGSWDGSKWVLLPTTITTTTDEAAATTACATITGNGTYAFIKYVTEPDKLPKYGMCTDNPQIIILMLIPQSSGPYLSFGGALLYHKPVPAVGATISYQVINSDPAGIVVSGGSGSGIVFATDPGAGLVGVFPPGGPTVPLVIEYNPFATYFEYVTVRVSFPDCYFDFQFTDDDFADLIGGWN